MSSQIESTEILIAEMMEAECGHQWAVAPFNIFSFVSEQYEQRLWVVTERVGVFEIDQPAHQFMEIRAMYTDFDDAVAFCQADGMVSA